MVTADNDIILHGLTLGYGSRVLVSNAEARFRGGCFTALVGRNGTGKSTLLRTVATLSRPLGGYVTIGGLRIDSLTRRKAAELVGFVSTDEVKVENMRVYDMVALGRTPYTNWVGSLTATDEQAVRQAISRVGMEEFAEKCISTLSDGERQRAMIARALAQDTPVILLDEPTAFLDLPNKYEIGLLLRMLAHEEGKCVVCSTHDLAVAIELCDEAAIIEHCGITCGSIATLADNGAFARLFEGSAVEFDAATRSVRLRR